MVCVNLRVLRGHEKKSKCEKCAPLFSIAYGRKMSVFPIFSHVPCLGGEIGAWICIRRLLKYLEEFEKREGFHEPNTKCRTESPSGKYPAATRLEKSLCSWNARSPCPDARDP